MVLPGDVGQVEVSFGPFGESVNLSTTWGHALRRLYHGHGKSFWAHSMVLQVMCVKWKLVSVRLEILLI
jgi:hypothetical protein